MNEPALRLERVTAGYRPDLPIVNKLDLEVRAGEIVAVLGPHGAGKSTAIKAVAGLVPVSAGRITLAGTDVTGLPTHRRVRAGLAFVPQSENVFARLSVRDNLQLGCFGDRTAFLASLDRVLALFPDLLRHQATAAGLLSGGQRQMVAIGRALMTAPSLLLLDEPTAGLAPVVTEQLLAQLDRIRHGGVAVVLVEQNVRAALAVADRACVLVEGCIRLSGPAATIADDPELGALFLGRRTRLAS